MYHDTPKSARAPHRTTRAAIFAGGQSITILVVMETSTTIRFFSKLLVLVSFCVSAVFAEEQDKDTPQNKDTLQVELNNRLSIVDIILPHNSLKNSETLHNWPFFAFAAPSWTTNFKIQRSSGKLATFKTSAAGDVNFAGLAIKLDVAVELIRLLELGMQANSATALNYGRTATMMGVYDVDKRNYRQDMFFTEFAYGYTYLSSLTLPILVLLPKSKWSNIILKLSGQYAYSAYTGADDGEVWKAGNANMVNGFHYKCGATLIYMLPFKWVPMAMVAGNVTGFKHAYDFDPAYKDYNPGFKTVNIIPMVSFKLTKTWSGMFMATISRARRYEEEHYKTNEELLQKQVGAEWDLRTIMTAFTRSF